MKQERIELLISKVKELPRAEQDKVSNYIGGYADGYISAKKNPKKDDGIIKKK